MQRIIREHFENLHSKNPDYLAEIDKFLDIYPKKIKLKKYKQLESFNKWWKLKP